MAIGGVANLSIIISAIDKASGTFSKVGGNLAKTGAKMKNVGKGMTMGLTLPIVGVGVAATKMGLDFSKGVEYANTMLKLSGEDLKAFKAGVLDLSDTYGKSAEDIARAGYSVSSVLHTSGEDTITILDSIAQAAKAGKISTEEAGNGVIRMMSIYGVKAEDAMKVVDTLSGTVKAGNANWQDMAQILPNVAGLAKPLGVSFNEVAGAFAAVSSKAGSSAEAGTALRGVLTGLMKPSDDMKDAMKEMGYANAQEALEAIGLEGVLSNLGEKYGDNAEKIGELFPNIRGITGAVAMFANEGKDLSEAMNMVADSTGETQKQIQAGQGSAENFSDAMNKLKNAGIRLFTAIEPMLTKFIAWISDLATKFSELSPATKKIIVVMAGLVAVLGPVLMVLGMILPVLPIIGAAFMALSGPIGLIIGIIIALGLVVALVIKNWTPIKAFFANLWEGVKSVFKTAWEFIKAIFFNATIPGLIISNWAPITAFFSAFWENIGGIFTSAKENMLKIWEGIIGGIKESVNSIIRAVNWLVSQLNKIHFSIPSWVPLLGGKSWGFNLPKIAELAEGGIVNKPTLALIGENGPEAVVPLKEERRIGGDINITITGNTFMSDEEAAEEIGNMIIRKLGDNLRL